MLRRLLQRRRTKPAPITRAAVTARHVAGRQVSYAPNLDGAADPGEIVWTSVAYEDQPFQAKDRPVLIVGRRDGFTLWGLMLSTRDHSGQRGWLRLGSGPWDSRHRPSWVRLDRILELHERAIRRESVALDRERFEQVAARLREDHGWR
jgi:hypothetical protein